MHQPTKKYLYTLVLMACCHSALADQASTATLFNQAISLRESGELDESIETFQTILSNEPSLGRVRAELAISYAKALNYNAAKQEVETLLAAPETPADVKYTLQNLLTELEKQSQPHLFTPYISMGIGHDTNVNVGPNSSTINLGGAQLSANANPISDNFWALNTGVAHRYLAPETVNVFGQQAAVIWQSNAGYFEQNYFDSGNFDIDVISLSTGPMLVKPGKWRANADLSYDYIELGHTKLAEFFGIAPTVSFNLSKSFDLTITSKFQQREFNDNVAPGRDSDYQLLNVSLTKGLLDNRLTVQVGTGVFHENAEINRFSNEGYQVSAGTSFKLNEIDTVYARHNFKNSRFGAPEVLFNQRRDENENRTTIGFNHRFTQQYVKDWVLDTSITHTDNASNVSIFDSRRTQFAINVAKQF